MGWICEDVEHGEGLVWRKLCSENFAVKVEEMSIIPKQEDAGAASAGGRLDLLSAALDESGLGLELSTEQYAKPGQNALTVPGDSKQATLLNYLGNLMRSDTSSVTGRPASHLSSLTPLHAIQQSALLASKGLLQQQQPNIHRVNIQNNSPTNGFPSGPKTWMSDEAWKPQMRQSTIDALNQAFNQNNAHAVETDDVDEDVEEDELGHAETYAAYMPSKLQIGEKHPDSVVETSSLSSVQPPDVWYRLSIPEEIIDYSYLSALQLEAIVYACQQHERFMPDGTRAGYLIGDGAGVGKGRTIAGIIYENYLLGRKRAIWVSVSNDLKYDAQRDLKDIGAGKLEVHALNKLKYGKISSKVNGSVKKGVIFATYSSLIGESQSSGKYKTRLKQLLHWCGKDFDGVIVFDECHKAKNLYPVGSTKPTKTGLTVLELQNRLPKARIVYASATGASEPRNMAYMTRLGLWGSGTAFREFTDYIQAVERRGVGAMEIVAMDMKLRGTYIARQLSFAGVSFRVDEIPLSKEFIRVYDACVDLWVDAREKFSRAVELIDGEQRMRKTMWGQFWSAHQRFFKYMCIASKVPHVVRLAREAVKNNKCVVIGLQSTGEARTLEQLEEAGGELTDFVSTAKGVFQSLIEKHFPAPDRKRVQRLLGLNSILDLSPVPSPSTSTGVKAVSERRARQGNKLYKDFAMSGDDEDDSNSVVPVEDQDSDFKLTESDSNEEAEEESNSDSPKPSDSSDGESDFNPFGGGSDDDDDPWLTRNKKKKKVKQKASSSKKRKKSAAPSWKPPKRRKEEDEKKKEEEPSKKREMNGKSEEHTATPPVDAIEMACAMKEELLAKLERLSEDLPPNTLDQLIDELGGADNVAEMTGRKGRIVTNSEGGIQYESRSEIDFPLETLNLAEKQRFMDGEKPIAIISEAASSGISLQSDRREKNQLRRVHITLELPWSADRAIQQFGRTHRSNQVNAPEYVFLISDLAGERRFASIVAKRLESLGALTHGDRRATESRDLSQFNIDNKYGRSALEVVMKSVIRVENPMVPPPVSYKGDFISDVQEALLGVGLLNQDERIPSILNLDKDYNNLSKFLNRILGMRVELQNSLFVYFSETLRAIITQAKRAGRFDMGILDLGTAGDQVKRIKCDNFWIAHATGTAKIELHTVTVERGMMWSEAVNRWTELTGNDEGFYISTQPRNGKQTAMLAVCNATASRKKDKKERGEKMYNLYRPNTGLQLRQESLNEIKAKYKKVIPDEAQPHWQEQYDSASLTCSHVYWRGSCKATLLGLPCDTGLRRKLYHILSGSVLSVWSKVETVMANFSGNHAAKMQVIRIRTEDGQRIVGSVIPLNCYAPLMNVLTQGCSQTRTDTF